MTTRRPWPRFTLLATTGVHLLLALLAFVYFIQVWGTWTDPAPLAPGEMCFDCRSSPWWEYPLEHRLWAAAYGVVAFVFVVATAWLWRVPSRRALGYLLAATAIMLLGALFESALALREAGEWRVVEPLVGMAWLAWLASRWRRMSAPG